MYDVPSIAVSQVQRRPPRSYRVAAEFTRHLAAKILERGLPIGVFLNVNIPQMHPIGVQVTRQGAKHVRSYIAEKDDPRGRKYYWIGEDQSECSAEPGTDYFAIKNRCVSISPLQRVVTAYHVLKACRALEKSPIPSGKMKR
jgi:5'-nucleotidase